MSIAKPPTKYSFYFLVYSQTGISKLSAFEESSLATDAFTDTLGANYNIDLTEVTTKLRSAVYNYYANGNLEEATVAFQELNPLPERMVDLVKDLLCQCVELSSEKDCAAFVNLLVALRTVYVVGSSAPVLNAEQVKEGVLKFLNVVDEMAIDVPKAVSYI